MKKLFIITGANGHLGGTIVRMLNGRPGAGKRTGIWR